MEVETAVDASDVNEEKGQHKIQEILDKNEIADSIAETSADSSDRNMDHHGASTDIHTANDSETR